MCGVFVGKTSKVVVFRGDGKSFVWGWLRLAWGAPHKVLLRGDVPTQVFFEWGLRGADLRGSVRQGCPKYGSHGYERKVTSSM